VEHKLSISKAYECDVLLDEQEWWWMGGVNNRGMTLPILKLPISVT